MKPLDRSAKRLKFLLRRSFLPRFSPDGTKIIFSAGGSGRCAIYQMNADGSELQCLTTGEGQYSDPVFSLDGTQIAFVASHPIYDEIHDIHIMNADGTNQRALTATHREYTPVFNPDGQQIAFVSGRDRTLEVYRMRADGSEPQRLTFGEDCPGIRPVPQNRSPVYCPDGGEIIFVSRPIRPGQRPEYVGRYVPLPNRIHSMRPDGTGQKSLLVMADGCDEPMFSPDGRWLAVRSGPVASRGPSSLCVIHADGTGLRRLPHTHGAWASFHPDGSRIVFASCEHRNLELPRCDWDLYCIKIDDGTLQRLTVNDARDTCPIFSPDGKQIVFCSDREGFNEIYTMPYDDERLR